MLVRDQLKRRSNTLSSAIIHLANDTTLFIEYDNTTYDIWVLPGLFETHHGCAAHHAGEQVVVTDADEFHAQCILDHHVASTGLKNNTKKPSGDTGIT